jgi:hypothetical protein
MSTTATDRVMQAREAERARLELIATDDHQRGDHRDDQHPLELQIVSAEDFAAIDEPGAEPIVGDKDDVLIAAGSDVMAYGTGGAGKTSLALDLGFHMAAAQDWLDFHIPKAVRVLAIENEGPRALLRRKLARKLEQWSGPALEGRLSILEAPWAQFTFATDQWRATLAQTIKTAEIDVLIAGPLVRIGMDGAGTLQEIAAFMKFIQDVRERSGQPITVILIHHENKGGSVSGAWEGAGDTLLHVEARGNGYTHLHIEKARWSSTAHNTMLDLAWTDGEGFKLKEDRDLLTDILALLADGTWRSIDEIRKAIKAGTQSVRDIVSEQHAERFITRTGEEAKALGRHPTAQLYQIQAAP